jgi:hypothetical protein
VEGNAINKLRSYPAIAALVLPAIVFAGAAPASAWAANEPVVTDVRTVAACDYAASQHPENVTVAPGGSLTVSMLGFLNSQPPELLRMQPRR